MSGGARMTAATSGVAMFSMIRGFRVDDRDELGSLASISFPWNVSSHLNSNLVVQGDLEVLVPVFARIERNPPHSENKGTLHRFLNPDERK
jgi:hypothetical protein